MVRLSYSGKSRPSVLKIAENINNVDLVRSSTERVDINWGRYKANATLNPDISNVTNKRRMRELFAEHGVPMPKLYTPDNWLVGLPPFPCVGRPDQHTRGRGFWYITNGREFYQALRGTIRKKAATHFMEYVDAPYEYRVHIFNGKSIRISEKVFSGVVNGHKVYTTGKPQCDKAMRKKLRDAAKQAVAAVGLDFGAADILSDGENVWVTEANSAPGVGGSMPKLYAEVFEKWKEENG